jgi:hypothetical protein
MAYQLEEKRILRDDLTDRSSSAIRLTGVLPADHNPLRGGERLSRCPPEEEPNDGSAEKTAVELD